MGLALDGRKKGLRPPMRSHSLITNYSNNIEVSVFLVLSYVHPNKWIWSLRYKKK